jgi:hypothetical protein
MSLKLCEHGTPITPAPLCANCHHCESDHSGRCLLQSKGCHCKEYVAHTAIMFPSAPNRPMTAGLERTGLPAGMYCDFINAEIFVIQD